jgi:glycosyltransferase involved in cell wall biosynthesis
MRQQAVVLALPAAFHKSRFVRGPTSKNAMKILYVTAGAAGMYCGSCLLDNALATALMAQGHSVLLLPVYTPTLTDEKNVSQQKVFFGGVSVYLEQYLSIFRRTPWVLDRLWDSPWLLKLVSGRAISPNPRLLGELTVSTLKGEKGFQRKEIEKMVHWLRSEDGLDVVHLSNSLLIALADPLKKTLKRPVCVTLQGEDLFLDGLQNPYRSAALDLIREKVENVDAFVAVGEAYGDFMTRLLGIPPEKMHVIPLAINPADFQVRLLNRSLPLRIGYLARVAPEKGLHVLCEAYRILRTDSSLPPTRLEAAGYLASEHRPYLADLLSRMKSWGFESEFHYHGVLDRRGKLDFLRQLDVFSVPVTYDDPKGLPVLEAMATGVPVVQPRLGSFREILSRASGGILVEPNSPESLAEGIGRLLTDASLAARLGQNGVEGVRQHYSIARMAGQTLALYEKLGAGCRERKHVLQSS